MPLSDIYEIRDLRLFTGRDLRVLLMEEATLWQRKLRWNYRESMELLIGYLDSRILPGFVAVHRPSGRLHGYTFAVHETQKAVLGDLFATESVGPDLKMELETYLLRYQLPMLQHIPGVERVESQLLLAGDGLQSTFADAGFRAHKRLFMEAELTGTTPLIATKADAWTAAMRVPGVATSLRLKRWAASMYQPAADLIHRAYIGHGDTLVNDQYATAQGCLRFLHNIIRFPGCGAFDAEHSWAFAEERSGELAGIALATRVEPETAHIPQLCIGPRWRGKGLGRLLLRHTATELAAGNMRALTLTVTEANTDALTLYRSLGFQNRHTFQANVWMP